MKTKLTTLFSLALVLCILPFALQAQRTSGSGEVIKQTREVGSFTGIKVGGAFNVEITPSEKISLTVESDDNLMDHIITEVEGNVLEIKSKGNIKNPSELNIYISLPNLTSLDVSGAANVYTVSGTTLSASKFEMEASGASNVNVNLNAGDVSVEISGAADVVLTGVATSLEAEVSGAGSLKAERLDTPKSVVNASGAGDIKIAGTGVVSATTSGAGSIKYQNNPTILTTNKSAEEDENEIDEDTDDEEVNDIVSGANEDTVNVRLSKKLGVKVNERNGVTEVQVGRHRLVVDEDGNVKLKKNYRTNSFDGHWGGFDLSVNGYLNSDMNSNFDEATNFMDYNMTKSVGVHLNLYEQNIQLNSSGTIGLITGLGIEWTNFRFRNNVTITDSSNGIHGYYNRGVDMEKSKLTISYLTLPILFEYQNHPSRKIEKFHVSAGVLLGLRLGSHTKRVFSQKNMPFELYDGENFATSHLVGTSTTSDDGVMKTHDDFHITPLKAEAMLRIGWGYINLFGKYSLTTLFRDGKGPELYPYSIGITLISW